MNDRLLVVFSKAPVPGRVKTRLTPPLSPERAAAVHEASLRDVVARAGGVEADLVIRYAGGAGSREYFRRSFPDLSALPQGTGDLGSRLSNAFDAAFASGRVAVVAIGADSPTLPPSRLSEAFSTLTRSDTAQPDVLLGPAIDGGYYLVGLTTRVWPRARDLFRHIPWSTRQVLGATLERAAELALGVELLDPWYDIDGIDDLRAAAADAQPTSHLGRLLALDGWKSDRA